MSKRTNTPAKQVKAVQQQVEDASTIAELEEAVSSLQHTPLEPAEVSDNSKAMRIMQSSKTTKERADKYNSRIARKILMEKLEPIQAEIEKIEDKIFDLENINLDTNINRGVRELTLEQVADRFDKIIDLSFQKDVLTVEYNSKVKAFNKYFAEEV